MNGRRLGLAAVLLPVLLAGCGVSGTETAASVTPIGGPTSGRAPTPSTTSATHSATGTTGTRSPAAQRVLSANANLSRSLFDLAAASTRVRKADNVSAPRRAVSDALSTTRGELTATRTAAYGTTVRSCSSVLAHASAASSGAGRVAEARSGLLPVTGHIRAEVASLEHVAGTVSRDLATLKSALSNDPHPPSVVTSAQVEAALQAARTVRDTALSDAATVETRAASAVTNAHDLSVQASTIAAKTCGS
jgi:hypothetical protein